MMESNFYSDEFEDLIRGKTEQYKMYPSEKVWKGVHGSLHTKRKWFIISMSLLITGTLFFAGKELIAPSHPAIAKKLPTPASTTTDITKTEEQHIPAPAGPAPQHEGYRNTKTSEQPYYTGITITIDDPVISQPDISEFLSRAVRLPAEAPALPVIAARMILPADEHNAAATGIQEHTTGNQDHTNSNQDHINSSQDRNTESGNANSTAGTGSTTNNSDGSSRDLTEAGTTNNGTAGNRSTAASRNTQGLHHNTIASTKSSPESTNDHGTISDSAAKSGKNGVKWNETIADQQRINWLADYAVYNLRVQPKRGRSALQLYFSPMVNYRALSGGNFTSKFLAQNIPVAAVHLGDAKNYVDHNPAFGFEMGSTLQYRLTRNLTVKAGLQFSFSRYTIKAYASNPQQATIALNSYYGYYLDSITGYSNISNFGGKRPVSLNNDYYQLAAPLGFELRIMGNERLQLNMGATIQPTYLINKNSYMLTTDYTNYVKEPSLLRNWNVNGALEAFLSYKTRSGLKWQIGPEFRYQLLSTYDNQYPIHEHLKGYGLKIGIVKPLP